jgi:hypothetical protein
LKLEPRFHFSGDDRVANLRELASYYRELQRRIEESGGEVTDEMVEDLSTYEGDINAKVDAISVLITDAEMWAERHKSDAAESQQMERVRRNAADRLKAYIKACLEDSGITRAGRKYPWLVKDNATPKFTWDRIGEPIPEAFRKVKTVPPIIDLDRDACLKAYQEGDSSSVFLPEGIKVERGRHVTPGYRKGRKLHGEGTGDVDL